METIIPLGQGTSQILKHQLEIDASRGWGRLLVLATLGCMLEMKVRTFFPFTANELFVVSLIGHIWVWLAKLRSVGCCIYFSYVVTTHVFDIMSWWGVGLWFAYHHLTWVFHHSSVSDMQDYLLPISYCTCWTPLGSTLWDYMHLAFMFVELLVKSWYVFRAEGFSSLKWSLLCISWFFSCLHLIFNYKLNSLENPVKVSSKWKSQVLRRCIFRSVWLRYLRFILFLMFVCQAWNMYY